MKKTHVIIAVAMGALAHAWAGSQSDGDYTVNAHGTEAGNLTVQGAAEMQGDATVQGALDIYSGLMLGETGEITPRSAVSFQYAEDGTNFTVTLSATRPETAFLWGDDGGGTLASKMKLDGNNILSLFNANGDATIVLDPATGNLNLEVSGGGLILSDGTELRQASDLQSSALYDSAGNAKVIIDGFGNLVVSAPATFEETLKANGGVEFAPGTVLDGGKAGYLQDVLANLGYREGEATDLMIPVFGGSVSDFKFDASGNVYVIGSFYGSVVIGGESLTSVGNNDIYVVKLNGSGNVIWANRFGGTSFDQAIGLAVDGSGNVYVTGDFSGTAGFGDVNLTSAGQQDVYVAKLDGSGNVIWVKRFGGPAFEESVGLALEGNGNVLLTGHFSGTAGFGGVNLTSAGERDVYVAKLDGSGNVIWANRFGGTSFDQAIGLGVDGSGNVYVTGDFSGTAGFGGVNLTSAGQQDVYVTKVDGSGNVTWAKRFGGANWDQPGGLAVDGSGYACVTGYFSGTASFGSVNLTSAGGNDVYVAKLDGSGIVTWVKRFGGTSSDQGSDVTIDGSGNAYVTGYFSGAAVFGGINMASVGGQDVYVAKLDGSGNVTWASRVGSASYESADKIALSSSGRLGLILSGASNFRIGDQMALGSPNGSVYLWEDGPVTQFDFVKMPLTWGGAAEEGAVALGEASFASGQGVIAAGNSTASGEFASAWGESSRALGYAVTAMGARTSATGFGSTSMGVETSATAYASTAMGCWTFATGDASTAMGIETSATGYASTAMGQGTSATGYSATAMGSYTSATGDTSTALGIGTYATSLSAVAIGRWNIGGGHSTEWNEQDPLFEIGNGRNSSLRANALTVYKNGDVEMTGRVTLPRQGDILMGEFGNPE